MVEIPRRLRVQMRVRYKNKPWSDGDDERHTVRVEIAVKDAGRGESVQHWMLCCVLWLWNGDIRKSSRRRWEGVSMPSSLKTCNPLVGETVVISGLFVFERDADSGSILIFFLFSFWLDGKKSEARCGQNPPRAKAWVGVGERDGEQKLPCAILDSSLPIQPRQGPAWMLSH